MAPFKRLKQLFIGKPRDIEDKTIFHKLSLVAFLAWVGLGADGLSSSCYGPQESFLALGSHSFLSIFVALGTVLTICVIGASYSQIVELFPSGGGGYTVATKLLSPRLGMIAGCALLIDYVLTITVSIASGADAIFSLLPLELHAFRIHFIVFMLLLMIVLNMRGVKESIVPLVPIFLVFLLTHLFAILYGFFTHVPQLPEIATSTKSDMGNAVSGLGWWGVIFLILRAYTMGAGTYTGIEAISNSLPVLREPRVETAKRTMRYMMISLSVLVLGLMLGYLLYNVTPQPGKTLNTILFERMTQPWNKNVAYPFVFIALFSEMMLLFVAAQAGLLAGPRVLSSMAMDRWLPTRFSMLSDRLVVQNGILIMGGFSLVLVLFTKGAVSFLIVLYSINVFITFLLSQLGMVRHWWSVRKEGRKWFKKIFVNGVGLILTVFILSSMIIFKFKEGGWITLLITGALAGVALLIRRHYLDTLKLLHRLNSLVGVAEAQNGAGAAEELPHGSDIHFDSSAKTAVLLVSGFNGMGLHTLFGVIRLFGSTFKNFAFVEIGTVDAGNFTSHREMDDLEAHISGELKRYIKFMNKNGYYAEGFSAMGVDVVEEVEKIVPQIQEKFSNAIFFGGQLIFPKDSIVLRFLHNYTVFALQKRLYRQGIPFVILPIRV